MPKKILPDNTKIITGVIKTSTSETNEIAEAKPNHLR